MVTRWRGRSDTRAATCRAHARSSRRANHHARFGTRNVVEGIIHTIESRVRVIHVRSFSIVYVSPLPRFGVCCASGIRHQWHLADRDETAVSVNQNGERDDGLREFAARFGSAFVSLNRTRAIMWSTWLAWSRNSRARSPISLNTVHKYVSRIYVRPAGQREWTPSCLSDDQHGVTSTRQISPRAANRKCWIIIYRVDEFDRNRIWLCFQNWSEFSVTEE